MTERVLPSPVAGHVPGPISRLLPNAGAPPSVLLETDRTRVLALSGRFGMSYILEGERSVAVVDCGSHADVEPLLRAVAFFGKPASLVVPSHAHFDHVLGLPALAARLGAPIATGPWTRRYFSGEVGFEPFEGWRYHRLLAGWVWEGLPLPTADDFAAAAALAVAARRARFFSPLAAPLRDGQSLDGFPGWRVLLLRGHSPEDLCLHHEEDRLFVGGDTLSNFLGGEWSSLNVEERAAAQERARIVALGPRLVLPGHGAMLRGVDVCRTLGVFQTRHYARTGRAAPLQVA